MLADQPTQTRMKSDLYTKVVLTVIASCLVYLVFKDHTLVERAHAQGNPPVPPTFDVNIIAVGGAGVAGTGALPVRIVK